MSRATCEVCGEDILDTTAAGIGKRIEGYVEARKGGGAHGVILMSEPKGFICRSDLALMRRGISIEQGTMFQ